jgi:RNA polymerase sigma-70 factor (ECF subfamily)
MPLPVTDESAERRLLLQVQRGSSDALATVFERHASTLYQLAFRLLGSPDEAEDVVQDVFVGLPVALERYEDRGAFVPWLRRVTARTALMKRRAERRRASTSDRAAHEQPRQAPAADTTTRIAIDDALGALPDSLRMVVVLRMIEGYSHEDVAAALGISVSASKVRLHRAVRQLQHVLGDPT